MLPERIDLGHHASVSKQIWTAGGTSIDVCSEYIAIKRRGMLTLLWDYHQAGGIPVPGTIGKYVFWR